MNTSLVLYQFKIVSLVGKGKWIQGPHWSVKQSTVIIKCTDNTFGAVTISLSKQVVIMGLTITHCGFGFYLYNVTSTILSQVSMQYNSQFGLFYNSTDSKGPILHSINFCSFYRNCLSISAKGRCGHAALNSYSNQVTYVINGTSFSFGEALEAGLFIGHTSSNKTEPNKLNIVDSLFYNNTGNICGGLYVNISSLELQLNDTKFMLNSVSGDISRNYAGAMSLTTSDYSSTVLYINNCFFKQNEGVEVGGLYLLLGCKVDDVCLLMDHVTFDSNIGIRGAALSIGSSSANIEMNHISITSSSYPKGLPINQYSSLFLYCAASGQNEHFIFLTNLTLANNSMTPLLTFGCKIYFEDEPSTFANNTSPLNGGAIWIDEQSFVASLNSQGSVKFYNNTASQKGGALYSESNIFRLPQRLLKVFSLVPRYCQFNDILAEFEGNEAGTIGNDIYGGEFYNCITRNQVYNINNFLQLVSCAPSWPVLNQFKRPLDPLSVSSNPFGPCHCNGSDVPHCSSREVYVRSYPGQWVALSLVTVGLCGGISPGVLATTSHGIHLTLIDSNQRTTTSCKPFTYELRQVGSNDKGYYEITTGTYELKNSSLVINVKFLECPEGFQLKQGICTCDEKIESVGNVNCNISTYPNYHITRSGNVWLAYDTQYNCTIAHLNCPFDYCNVSLVSFSLKEPDGQCTQSRSGTLCGQCLPGFSLMLGSNKCGVCSNKYLSLIPAFIIAGLGLIFVLLTLNLTVSTGSINGLLFYANMMKLNEQVLFPNGGIPVLTQFISWLNLDFGFNVCFFSGLDGYWKTWLQFTFSLSLIVFILVCCRFSGKLSRLFGRNVISALSTLIFMAHTKILLTVRNALMVAVIECGSTHSWYVWSIDGNIGYLSGKHIPLFVVSVIFLLTGLMYTVVVLCSQWLQYYSGRYCNYRNPYISIQPFIDAYTGPFKEQYRFWFGIRLVIYLILATIFAYTTGIAPRVNNYVTALICFVLLPFTKGKYTNRINTALEFFYILNLGTTSLLNTFNSRTFSFYVNMVSILLSVAGFGVMVTIHITKLLKSKCGQKFAGFPCCRDRDGQENDFAILAETIDREKETGSPALKIERRESLIYDLEVN